MDDEPILDATEPLDYVLVSKDKTLDLKVRPKKRSGLDSKIPVDLCLFGSVSGTVITGLLMRRNHRKYRNIHQKFAYASVGFACLHLYQHRKVVIGYAKKKCRNARTRLDELLDRK